MSVFELGKGLNRKCLFSYNIGTIFFFSFFEFDSRNSQTEQYQIMKLCRHVGFANPVCDVIFKHSNKKTAPGNRVHITG